MRYRLALGFSFLLLTAAAPAGVRAADTRPATRPATQPAAPPTTQQAALVAQAIDAYMACDWAALEAALKNVRDLTVLPKDMAADIVYLRQALADGRQAWWSQVKAGNKMNFRFTLWERAVPVTFDPALPIGTVQIGRSGGQRSITVHWEAADMDNPALAEHGFTKGDLAYVNVWSALELVELYLRVDPATLLTMNAARRKQFTDYLSFRGQLATAVYATPRGREWVFFLACDAYQNAHLTDGAFIPKRPLAALLVAEIASHPTKYPTLTLPESPPTEHVEQRLATHLMPQFEKKLTYGEDKLLRDAVRVFANSNVLTGFETGKVVLPNKLEVAMDPAKDGDLSAKREAWLKEQLAHSNAGRSGAP